MTPLAGAAGVTLALGGVTGATALWRRAHLAPAPLTDAELVARTSTNAVSEGARWVRLPGGQLLTWWEFGDPRGAPLVALHGLGVSGLSFAEHDAFFRARGLRCIAPTLLGGLADATPTASIADLATTVLRLVDHLGLDQWLVFGVSYGTLPVLALAALAPRRVLSAGLFGTYLHERWCAQDVTTQAGFKSDNALLHLVGRRWPSALFPWMRGFGMMSPAQVMGRFEDASLPQTERALLHPAHPYHQRFARLWAECGQRGFWYLAQGWSLAINQPPGFTLEQVDAGGASLFVETGEHDNVHLPRMSAFVAERVRAAKLNVVTGNGRLGCVSERLEAGLSRFLSRGAAPAP